MKICKLVTVFVSLFVCASHLYSQGFDWQYSYRFPAKSPRIFYSAGVNFDVSSYSSDLNFSENVITCCRFKKGNASNSNVCVGGEYWLRGGETALNASIGWKHVAGSFEANPDPVYYVGDTLYTQIKSDIKINYINFDFGIKSRIKLTHWFCGGGLGFDILTTNSYTNKEIVTSPNHAFNDGSTERVINNGKTSSLSAVVVYPKLYLGYDLNLGLGMYAQPKFSFGVNLNNIVTGDKWRTVNFGFGISIYRGIR